MKSNLKNSARATSVHQYVSLFLALLLSVHGITLPVSAAEETQPIRAPQNWDVQSLKIPKELGWVESFFPGLGRPVILIQDAHSAPDAQKKIEQLIQYLSGEYSIRQVGLEGAASHLDARFFQSFPDQKKLRRVLDGFAANAELTGGNAAAIFDTAGTHFFGVEDWPLYEEGLRLFQSAEKSQTQISKTLSLARAELESEKRKIFTPPLLAVDQALDAFNNNEKDLFQALQTLAHYKRPEPQSELALILNEVEKNPDLASVLDLEARGFAKKIKDEIASLSPAQRAAAETEFNSEQQAFLTGQKRAEEFTAALADIGKRYALTSSVPKGLLAAMNAHKRLNDLRAGQFMQQFQDYAAEVKAALFSQPEEKVLDRRSRDQMLLEKLSRLELSLEEWREVQTRKKEMKWSAEFERALEPQMAFYENAEKRDAAFISQMDRLAPGSDPVILVTGGFHSAGVVSLLRNQGHAYALISPEFRGDSAGERYRMQMRGEVSWASYLKNENGKVDLRAAFIRAVRDRLLNEESKVKSEANANDEKEESSSRLLKEWRDQLLNDLAKENKVEIADEYTRFIDETLKSGNHPGPADAVQRFLGRLQDLESSGGWNQNNVRKLLSGISSSTAAPVIASGVLSKVPVSADLLLSVPARSELRSIFNFNNTYDNITREILGSKLFEKYESNIEYHHSNREPGVVTIKIYDLKAHNNLENFKLSQPAAKKYKIVRKGALYSPEALVGYYLQIGILGEVKEGEKINEPDPWDVDMDVRARAEAERKSGWRWRYLLVPTAVVGAAFIIFEAYSYITSSRKTDIAVQAGGEIKKDVNANPSRILQDKLNDPENARRNYLLEAHPDIAEFHRDELNSLLSLVRNDLLMNQSGADWMQPSDSGYLLSAYAAMLVNRPNQPNYQNYIDYDTSAVSEKVRATLKMLLRLREQFGLKVNQANTGLLPKFFKVNGDFFEPDKEKMNGGIIYSPSNDIALHVRLLLIKQFYLGKIFPGDQDAGIVEMTNQLLKIDFSPYYDETGNIHDELRLSDNKLMLSPKMLSSEDSAARLLVTSRRPGITLEERMPPDWTFFPAGEQLVPIAKSADLSAVSEFAGGQFFNPGMLALESRKKSNGNYLYAAAYLANRHGHLFMGTAPAVNHDGSIVPFGFGNDYAASPAGAAAMLVDGRPETVNNFKTMLRVTKEAGSYQPSSGLPDLLDPLTGRAYENNPKQSARNMGEVIEYLNSLRFTAIVAESPNFRTALDIIRRVDWRAQVPPHRDIVKTSTPTDLDLFSLIRGTSELTSTVSRPGSLILVEPPAIVIPDYRVGQDYPAGGGTLNLSPLTLAGFKTMQFHIADTAKGVPDQLKFEFFDDAASLGAVYSPPGLKAGATVNVDISPIADAAEYRRARKMELSTAGAFPSGGFSIDSLRLMSEPIEILQPRPAAAIPEQISLIRSSGFSVAVLRSSPPLNMVEGGSASVSLIDGFVPDRNEGRVRITTDNQGNKVYRLSYIVKQMHGGVLLAMEPPANVFLGRYSDVNLAMKSARPVTVTVEIRTEDLPVTTKSYTIGPQESKIRMSLPKIPWKKITLLVEPNKGTTDGDIDIEPVLLGTPRSELRWSASVQQKKAEISERDIWRAAALVESVLVSGRALSQENLLKVSAVITGLGASRFSKALNNWIAAAPSAAVYAAEQQRLLAAVRSRFPDTGLSLGMVLPETLAERDLQTVLSPLKAMRLDFLGVSRSMQLAEIEKLAGAKVTPVNFNRRIFVPDQEGLLPVAVVSAESRTKFAQMYLPVVANLENVQDYFLRQHVRFLQVLSAAVMSGLIKTNPEFKNNRNLLLAELLKVLGKISYETVITFENGGFNIDPLAVRIQMQMAASQAVGASA